MTESHQHNSPNRKAGASWNIQSLKLLKVIWVYTRLSTPSRPGKCIQILSLLMPDNIETVVLFRFFETFLFSSFIRPSREQVSCAEWYKYFVVFSYSLSWSLNQFVLIYQHASLRGTRFNRLSTMAHPEESDGIDRDCHNKRHRTLTSSRLTKRENSSSADELKCSYLGTRSAPPTLMIFCTSSE